jgi:hypothetical protein
MQRFLWILIPCGMIAAAVVAGTMDIETGPRPEIRVVQTPAQREGTRYVLEIVNPTSKELVYWGYGANSPMYQMEILEDGKWTNAMLGWCGTGATTERIPPHGTQQFEVSIRDSPSKIGLLLLPRGFKRSEAYQFEWLPFAVRSKLVMWQNDRLDERTNKKVVWSERLDPLPPQPPGVAYIYTRD